MRFMGLIEPRHLCGPLPQLLLTQAQVLREGVALGLHRLALLWHGSHGPKPSKTNEKQWKTMKKTSKINGKQ